MFISDGTLELVRQIAHRLTERQEYLAVSESCCGGLIASYLVSVPGASRFFLGGTTTYNIRSRLTLSGWSQEDISGYTGPSEGVAVRLARNLKLEMGATYTLAETGIAGGGQGSEETGKAFLAICTPKGNQSKVMETEFVERTANMEAFAEAALQFLLEVLDEDQI